VPSFVTLCCALVVAGIAMNITNTSNNTLIQVSAVPSARGQAVSLYMLAMRGGLALGALLTGALTHVYGIRSALLVDGLAAVVIQGVIVRWAPSERNTEVARINRRGPNP
jgi:MFS family permease